MVYHFNFLEKNAFEMEHVCRVIVYVRFLKKTKLQLIITNKNNNKSKLQQPITSMKAQTNLFLSHRAERTFGTSVGRAV